MSTIVDGATAVVRGIVGEAAARDGHLVGVGDGAALSDTGQSRVALEGAVGDFDLAVGAVPHSAAVTGRVAFEGGPRDGDGAEGAEITRSVVDGTAGARRHGVALEGAVGDDDGTIAVVDGTGNIITGVVGEGHAIDRQRSPGGVVDGTGGRGGRVAFKAAAVDGQRAFVPNGAAEIGIVALQIDIVKGEVTLGARFVIAIENGTALVGGGIPGHSDIRNYSCTFIVQLGTLRRRKATGEGAASERQLVLCTILQRCATINCNFDFSVDGRVVDSYADTITVAVFRPIVDVKSDSVFFSDDGGIIDRDVTMIVGHGVSAIS